MVTTILMLGAFVAVGIGAMVATAKFVFAPDFKNPATPAADSAGLISQRVA